MSDKPTLSLGNKLSVHTLNQLQKLNTKNPNTKQYRTKATSTNVLKSDIQNKRSQKPVPSKKDCAKKQRIDEHNRNREQGVMLYKKHLAHFSKLYPNCFGIPPKPLAIGIHNDLFEKELKRPEKERLTNGAIRRFLSKYTRSVVYKECMQVGSARVNLQGENVGEVSLEHAESYKHSLELWRSKQVTPKSNNKPIGTTGK